MSAVALIYVGAVLALNGLLLLGWVTPREAGPLNIFVGVLQVFTPTYLIITAGSADEVFAASGIYLFGFTYLWVGINCFTDHSNRGFGWFALMVAMCTVVYAADNFVTVGDYGFGVIWLLWGVLWFLFFLVLGLGLESLGPPTGFFTLVAGVITAVAAFMILLGGWTGGWKPAVVIAIVGVVALLASGSAAKKLPPPTRGVVD